MKITFLVDLLCLVIFGMEAIIKTKRRGLLVEGGYLRSRSASFSNKNVFAQLVVAILT